MSARRRMAAVALAVVLLPLTTVALHPGSASASLQTILLTYLLIAVVVAFVGGAFPGIGAAVVGFVLANWFFTSPFRTLTVDDPENLLGLLVFLLVASVVGILVGVATRRAEESNRARAQVEALATSLSSFDLTQGFEPLVENVRSVFGARSVTLFQLHDGEWRAVASAGPLLGHDPAAAEETVDVDGTRTLALDGVRLGPEDRRVLAAFAAHAGDAVERDRLRREAAQMEAMTETDRLRTALLGAVSHDLRTPLASIKANVTSLVETDIDWTEQQRRSFLLTIQAETERLNRLVGQLLDAGRIQVGAIHVNRRPSAVDEVVSAALASLSMSTGRVDLDVDESLPLVDTDPVLLERAIANLIDNALNHTPEASRVHVRGVMNRAEEITVEIVDQGTGIPEELREQVFRPFHRLDDGRSTVGVGLGLAVTRGFLDALHVRLALDETPGGGTTARFSLPVWALEV